MRGRLRRATIKLLALTILFPITFSLTSTQMIRGIHQLSIPLHGYGSREFRMNNLCSHSGSTTISSEIPPEPLQVVSLAEDLPFWLELQGEVFDGSAQIHELKRFDEFCANYRANPNRFSLNGHGQIVSPVGNFPGLRAQPIHNPFADTASFPWAAALEANAATIIEEYYAHVEEVSFRPRKDDSNQFKLITGCDKMAAAASFPETSAFLRRWGLGQTPTGTVAFNCYGPGSVLPRHSDACNWLLSGYLGVSIPLAAATAARGNPSRSISKRPVCGFEIDGKSISWEVGKVKVLDTSFRHCSWNNHPTDSQVTFVFNFFHPDLSAQERRALNIFTKVFDSHVRRHERLRAENSAALNRIFVAEVAPEFVLQSQTTF